MIRPLLPTLLSTLALFLAATESPAQPPIKGAKDTRAPAPGQKSPRFSAEAIELFCLMSQNYDFAGTQYSSKADAEAILPFTRSADPDLREIAEMSRNLFVLHTLHQQQGKVIARAFAEQADKWPAIFGEQLLKALSKDGKKTSDITRSVKLVEKLMGTQPQKVVNEGWLIAYLGNELSLATAEKMRLLALRPKLANAAPMNAIEVQLETATNKLGTITFTNRTNKTLHNCLVLTRLNVDREFVRSGAAKEELVGKLVLPLLGFSKQTVAGSLEAARLRSLFAEQDKGGVLYLAEVPPGGSVTTNLTRPDFFLFSKGAYVSVFCDEFAVEQQSAPNFAEAKLAVQNSRKAAPKKGK